MDIIMKYEGRKHMGEINCTFEVGVWPIVKEGVIDKKEKKYMG